MIYVLESEPPPLPYKPPDKWEPPGTPYKEGDDPARVAADFLRLRLEFNEEHICGFYRLLPYWHGFPRLLGLFQLFPSPGETQAWLQTTFSTVTKTKK